MRPLFVRCSLFVRFIRCVSPVFRLCLVQVLQVVVLADHIHLLHLRRKGASSSSLTADQGKDSQADVAAGLAQIFSPEGLCCAGSSWIYVLLWIIQCRILRCHAWSSKRLSMSIIPDTLSRVWMFVISYNYYNDLTTLLALCLVRPQNSVCRMLYLSALYSGKRSFRWFP